MFFYPPCSSTNTFSLRYQYQCSQNCLDSSCQLWTIEPDISIFRKNVLTYSMSSLTVNINIYYLAATSKLSTHFIQFQFVENCLWNEANRSYQSLWRNSGRPLCSVQRLRLFLFYIFSLVMNHSIKNLQKVLMILIASLFLF